MSGAASKNLAPPLTESALTGSPKPGSSRGRRDSYRIFDVRDVRLSSQSLVQWIPARTEMLVSFITSASPSYEPFRTVVQRTAFQEGIQQLLAKLPETALFDNGLNFGFSRILGNTIRGLDVFHQHMAEGFSGPSKDAEERIIHSDALIGLVPKSGEALVDSNHRRTVILEGKSDEENIKLRAELEIGLAAEVANRLAKTEAQKPTRYPKALKFVVVLISGGLEELGAIAIYLRKKIPIILLEGSGGVADLLGIGFRQSPLLDETIRKQELTNHAREIFPELRNDPQLIRIAVDLHMAVLKLASADFFPLLAVATPRNLANLDESIVTAVINASSTGEVTQTAFESNLHFAIKCYRPDVVQNILLGDPTWEHMQIPTIAFEDALIQEGRSEFVDMFLQQGFPVRDYLSHLKLLKLFQGSVNQHFFRYRVWMHILGYDDMEPLRESFLLYKLNPLIQKLCGIKNYIDFAELSSNAYHLTPDRDNLAAERKAFNVLAVYGCLVNDEKFLHVLIKHSEDPIPFAFFIESMLCGLARHINNKSVKEDVFRQAMCIGEVVLGMFEVAVKENEQRAQSLLIRQVPDYNNRTVLALAYYARDKKFTAHPTVQEFLDLWYYGFISVKGSFNTVKMLLSAIFFFPISIWLQFPALERNVEKVAGFTGYRALLPPRPTTLEDKNAFLNKVRQGLSQQGENLHEQKSLRPSIPFSEKVFAVWNSPVIKLHLDKFMYFAFLVLIAIDVMLPPCRFPGVDIAVFVLTCTRWCELVAKAISDHQTVHQIKWPWRITEIILELTFNILFFLYRIEPFRYAHPFAGRVILSFGVFYFYYRVWDMFFYIDAILGPSIRMVVRTFKYEVLKWLVISYPIFIGAGLVWQATTTPDWPMTGDEWRKALYRSVFTIFGGFYTDLEFTNSCEAMRIDTSYHVQPLRNVTGAIPPERCWIGDYTDYTCNTVTVWSYIFYVHYYFFVLLGTLNMLGSWIFTRFIDDWVDNLVVCKYNRCSMIIDYSTRSALPPPFSVFGYLFSILTSKKSKLPARDLPRKENESLLQNQSAVPNDVSVSYWSSLALRFYRARQSELDAKNQALANNQQASKIQSDLTVVLQQVRTLESVPQNEAPLNQNEHIRSVDELPPSPQSDMEII